MQVLMGIDWVINEGSKSSTYKFALLTAMMDYIIENPSENPRNGFHSIPIIYLAKQFLYYYYPLRWYGNEGIKQSSSRGLGIYSRIDEYLNNEVETDFVIGQPEAVQKIRELIDSNKVLSKSLVRLILKIRATILDMPLTHIKIGGQVEEESKFLEYNTKTKNFILFGLGNSKISGSDGDDYEYIVANSSWTRQYVGGSYGSQTWWELENSEQTYLKMGHFTYTELRNSRLYIRDAIINRWIEFSVDNYLKNDGKAVYLLINRLNLFNQKPERDNDTIKQLRGLTQAVFDPLQCMYCDKEIELTTMELDHFIPWSKYPTNYFWNLFPSCQSCNSAKRDKVIQIDDQIQDKLRGQLNEWVNYFNTNLDDWRRFGGREFDIIETMSSQKDRVDYLIDQLQIISLNLI